MLNNKTDSQIQLDVINELKWDSRVEATAVGVEVERGVVTLTGAVSSWAKKVAAAEAAHRVVGVLDVANDITVRPPGVHDHSDADIATAVRHALKWDVFVPDEKIQSTVSNGLVTLAGHVEHASQREDAARAVRNLAGVRGIANHIIVERSKVSPGDIRNAIHSALERHAERDADEIDVDVDGGAVTLRGKVHSWMERDAVIGAAWATRGVEAVLDRMIIG